MVPKVKFHEKVPPGDAAPVPPRSVFKESQQAYAERIFQPMVDIVETWSTESKSNINWELKESRFWGYKSSSLEPFKSKATRSDAAETVGMRSESEMTMLQADSKLQQTLANDENQADEEIYLLFEMFPNIPSDIIRSAFRDQDSNVEKTTEYLLSWETIESESQSGSASEAQQRTSARELKQERQARKANRKVQRSNKNEDKNIAFISATLNISDIDARELYWTHENNVSEALASRIPVQPLTTKFASSMANSETSRVSRRQQDIDLGEYSNMSTRELNQQIADLSKRIETLQGLHLNPSKNNHDRIRVTENAKTIHSYQSQIRLMQLALHKTKKLGSSGLFSSTNVIDLHGCTLDQAKPIVSEAIKTFRESSFATLEIITGAGRHSFGGKAVLKNWLRKYLKQANVRMEELEGSFVVSQKPRV